MASTLTAARAVVLAGLLAVAAVGGVALAATPTAAQEEGWDYELTATFSADGDIETVEISVVISEQEHTEFNQFVGDDYDSVAVYFAETVVSDNDEYESYSSATETTTASGVRLSITLDSIDMADADNTTTTVGEDSLDVELVNVSDPADDPQIDEFTYHLEMPYPVADSNADEVDGSVATWYLHETARSELTVSAAAGAGGGDGDGSDGGVGPGFGVIAALLSIASLWLAGRLH